MASDPRQEIRRFAVQGLTLPKVSHGRLPDFEKPTVSSNPLLRRSDASRQPDLPPKAIDMIGFLVSPTSSTTSPTRLEFSAQSRAATLDAVSLRRAIKLTLGLIELEYARAEKVKDVASAGSSVLPSVKRL